MFWVTRQRTGDRSWDTTACNVTAVILHGAVSLWGYNQYKMTGSGDTAPCGMTSIG